MRDEDLIKKMEGVELPEAEIASHKASLKQALIDWKYNKPREHAWSFFPNNRILVPAGALVLLVFVCLGAITLFGPQYTLANAKKIALQNPQIKNLIEGGSQIKDTIVVGKKAYVLITPKDATVAEKNEGGADGAVLAEIGLKENAVLGIKTIEPKTRTLTQQEEEKTREIITKSEIGSVVPSEFEKSPDQTGQTPTSINAGGSTGRTVKIEKIEAVPTYNLKIEEKNGTVEVSPQEGADSNVKVTYEIDGETKEGEVNLSQERVGNIKVIEIKK